MTGDTELRQTMIASNCSSRHMSECSHNCAAELIRPLIAPAWNLLPEDRQNRYLTIVDPSRGPSNAQTSAESREVFFWMAVDLWKKSPLTGYGPGSFPLASQTGMQVHSLYGQLLAEVGLLGIAAFLALLGCYLLNVRETARCWTGVSWRERGFTFWLQMAILVSVVMLLLLGLSGHNLYRYTWLWYAAFSALAVRFARERIIADDTSDHLDSSNAESECVSVFDLRSPVLTHPLATNAIHAIP